MVGDIVGAPGRKALAEVVGRMRSAGEADLVVANAENAAGGKGLTGPLASELLKAGANALTLGDHTWDQKEIAAYLDTDVPVIRPANFAPGCPGRGLATVRVGATGVTVINLVGRVFMDATDCPFRVVNALLNDAAGLGRIILVDMHAEATAEKVVMGRYLDGRVTAVVGTHTHVQTSDETILPGGTAYITDLGMTGGKNSAIGRDLESVTAMLLTGMPTKFRVSNKDVTLEGVLIEANEQTGKATAIRRVREPAGIAETEQE
ncbi:MAG: TIGR00282 family metallophosphoesterase [Verrucomicrobiota bacterium]|nr:TIGR00282 family metallophosphoesterase [Verrucomicrobiota bacterium]